MGLVITSNKKVQGCWGIFCYHLNPETRDYSTFKDNLSHCIREDGQYIPRLFPKHLFALFFQNDDGDFSEGQHIRIENTGLKPVRVLLNRFNVFADKKPIIYPRESFIFNGYFKDRKHHEYIFEEWDSEVEEKIK